MPQLEMTKNTFKSRVYSIGKHEIFGLAEFSMCPETRLKGIFKFKGAVSPLWLTSIIVWSTNVKLLVHFTDGTTNTL